MGFFRGLTNVKGPKNVTDFWTLDTSKIHLALVFFVLPRNPDVTWAPKDPLVCPDRIRD